MGTPKRDEISYCFVPMRWGFSILLCLCALAMPLAASADDRTSPVSAEDQAKAQQHYQRARELYQSGSYRDAIGELEAARALDPHAKDLVFNLGTVHEKLGRFDEAIQLFRDYMAMDGVTAAERAKAETVIKRIEGAKREAAQGGTPSSTPGTEPTEAPIEKPASPERGRVDTATIAAASVAVVGLGVGTIFGIRALAMRPSDFTTGRDGSYETLKNETDDAHMSAVIADVGFGIGIVGAVAAAYLYFGRTKEPSKIGAPASFAPVRGGGVFLLGGSFR